MSLVLNWKKGEWTFTSSICLRHFIRIGLYNSQTRASLIWHIKHTPTIICIISTLLCYALVDIVDVFLLKCWERCSGNHDDVIKWKHIPRNWLLWAEFADHRGKLLTKASDADVFFDLYLNNQLSKQSRRWWLRTPSRSLWRHCTDIYEQIDSQGAL